MRIDVSRYSVCDLNVTIPTRLPRNPWFVLILWLALIGVCLVVFQIKVAHKMGDFDVYYRAGARFVAGEMLYAQSDGHYQFKYPPMAAALFAPLSRLPFAVAKATWFAISVVALTVSLWICVTCLTRPSRSRLWLVGLTLLVEAKFFGHELTLGQVNAVLLLLFMTMTYAILGGKPISAGILLALAISIKPYALLFLPFLVFRKRLAAAASASLTLFILALIPIWRYGWDGNASLYRRWQETLAQSTPDQLLSNDNISLFGFFAKWLGPAQASGRNLAVGLVIALLVATVGWCFTRRTDKKEAIALETSVLLILMPLFSPLGWDYVFLWSTPGVMLLLDSWASLTRPLRTILVVTLAMVSGTIYDVMGRTLYRAFMARSLLTPVFVVLVALLLIVRVRMAQPDASGRPAVPTSA
jgi:alpha-1,2-mannosyltransferase